MKRSALFLLCSVALLGTAWTAAAEEPTTTIVNDLEIQALAEAPSPVPASDLAAMAPKEAASEVDPLSDLFRQDAGTSTSLGSITCLCICEGPIWSIEDVRTTGSCDDLVGQACWSWGPGVYTSCFQDGPGPLSI